MKVFLLEEDAVYGLEHTLLWELRRGLRRRQSKYPAYLLCQVVEFSQVVRDVETRVFFAGDEQSR